MGEGWSDVLADELAFDTLSGAVYVYHLYAVGVLFCVQIMFTQG